MLGIIMNIKDGIFWTVLEKTLFWIQKSSYPTFFVVPVSLFLFL